jgi:hypothetical protein
MCSGANIVVQVRLDYQLGLDVKLTYCKFIDWTYQYGQRKYWKDEDY